MSKNILQETGRLAGRLEARLAEELAGFGVVCGEVKGYKETEEAQGAMEAQEHMEARGAMGTQEHMEARGAMGAQGGMDARGAMEAQEHMGTQGAMGTREAMEAEGAIGTQGAMGAQGNKAAEGHKAVKRYRAAGMPGFYRETYRLFSTRLNGIPCLLMQPRGDTRLTPAMVQRHAEALRLRTNLQPVYVARTLPPHGAARLTALGVPFLLGNRRLFLPFLSLVQSRGARADYRFRPKLATCTQLLVLGCLLKRLPQRLTRSAAAAVLPYSPAAVTAAFDELESRGWGHRERSDVRREQFFVWDKTGKELWRAAQSYLKSPCRREYGVERIPQGAVLCGRSRLMPGGQPCEVALFYRDERLLKPAPYPQDEAPVMLHVWSYPPLLFGKDGCPDTLSLYLSLRHTGDLAVKQANEKMLREMEW